MAFRKNVLLITIDQLRADVINGELASCVPTPNIDALKKQSLNFCQHYTVTAPCGPARASLLTGLYARRHGALRNGTPLLPDLTNLALEGRKLGYEPLLFGYTDTQPNPKHHHPNDPDLRIYEGVMPGFREICEMRLEAGYEYPAYLASKGYDLTHYHNSRSYMDLYRPVNAEPGAPTQYHASDSETAYLTTQTINHLNARRNETWFACVTYIRPHPPFIAPEPYNCLIDPQYLPAPKASLPGFPFSDAWFAEACEHNLFWGFDGNVAGLDANQTAQLRANYLGLVAEVDHHLGRILSFLDETGQLNDTLIIVTADHGEMLGDYGMWGKHTIFDEAFHIPLLIRLPENNTSLTISEFTESVDILPTILDWLGTSPRGTWNGRSLLECIERKRPWRQDVLMEIELGSPIEPTRFQRYTCLGDEPLNAIMLRNTEGKFTYFNHGLDPVWSCEEAHLERFETGNDISLERMSAMGLAMLSHIQDARVQTSS